MAVLCAVTINEYRERESETTNLHQLSLFPCPKITTNLDSSSFSTAPFENNNNNQVANFQGLKSAEVTAMVQRTRNWSKQAFVPAGAAVNPADAAAVGGAAAAFHRAAAGDGHDSSYGDSHCNGCASRGEDEQHSSNGNGRSCHGTSTCNCSSSGSTKKNNSTTCRALPASPSWRRCAYRIASKGINNRHTGGGAHQAAKHGLEDRAAYWARAAQDTPAFYRFRSCEI